MILINLNLNLNLTAGSYSESAGVEVIRRHVADYIEHRDGGVASDYNDVFLSNGASDGIRVRNQKCGPMPNVMAALPNIGGALCSTPQSLADAHN